MIREVKEKDAKQVLELIKVIYGEAKYMSREQEEFKMSLEQQKHLIRKYIKEPFLLFLVVEVDETIVGTLTFNGSDLKRFKHSGEIGMSILSSYQGRGIGKQLLEFLFDWCSYNEISKINLQVMKSNVNAIKLYEKTGFEYEGEIIKAVKLGSSYESLILMGKVI